MRGWLQFWLIAAALAVIVVGLTIGEFLNDEYRKHETGIGVGIIIVGGGILWGVWLIAGC